MKLVIKIGTSCFVLACAVYVGYVWGSKRAVVVYQKDANVNNVPLTNNNHNQTKVVQSQKEDPTSVKGREDLAKAISEGRKAGSEFARSPEGRKAAKDMLRRSVERRYGNYAREAGLSVQEWEVLKSILIDMGDAARDVFISDEAKNLNVQEKQKVADVLREEYKNKLKALLGERFDGFNQYNKSYNERRFLDQLLDSAPFKEQLISTSDLRNLSLVMNAVNEGYGISERNNVPREQLEQTRERYNAFLGEGRRLLTPEQFNFLKERLADDLEARGSSMRHGKFVVKPPLPPN